MAIVREGIENAVQLAKATARWVAAGSPVRSEERIREIHAICEGCDKYFEQRPGWGKCKVCRCRLNITGKLNKILMATESCPKIPPLWGADVAGKDFDDDVRVIDQRTGGNEMEERVATQVRPSPSADAMAAHIAAEHPDGDVRPKLTRAEMRAQRAAARQERIQARAERIAAREEGKPPVVQPVPSQDPLEITCRDGTSAGHTLRDQWIGQAGFLVCGGPSLQDLDLSVLRERGIVSLGINNVAAYSPVRAFCCGDPPEKFHHGVWFDAGMQKFVPTKRLGSRVRAKLPDGLFAWTAYRVRECPAVWGFRRDSIWEPANFLTRPAATWGRKDEEAEKLGLKIFFSFFLGLRLLHYFGCPRVYLIGADFSMDSERKYAFGQDRSVGAIRGCNNSYRLASPMCDELAPHFEKAGYHIVNCNRQSRLKTWPYVPFDEAVEDCRGMVPAGELDTENWYDKDEGPMEARE